MHGCIKPLSPFSVIPGSAVFTYPHCQPDPLWSTGLGSSSNQQLFSKVPYAWITFCWSFHPLTLPTRSHEGAPRTRLFITLTDYTLRLNQLQHWEACLCKKVNEARQETGKNPVISITIDVWFALFIITWHTDIHRKRKKSWIKAKK